MMKIQTVAVPTWLDFKSKVILDQSPEGSFQQGRFLFRGHGSESWNLSSSFDRWYKNYDGKSSDKAKIANQLLVNFTKQCDLKDMPQNVRESPILSQVFAQHYGLPTCLLDWSESAYVAAFFAFSSHIRHLKPAEQNVAVWALDSTDSIWNSGSGCEILSDTAGSFDDVRIRNQKARFTCLRSSVSSLEEYVLGLPGEKLTLLKYVIPVREAGAAVADLDSMGLSHAQIYPGLSAIAKAAEVRVIISMFG
jgi:hypothetical protein